MKRNLYKALALLLATCTLMFALQPALADTAETAEGSEYPPIQVEYKKKDTNADYDSDDCTVVQFTGGSANITGDGATFSDSDLVITEAGNYIIRGELSTGGIVIDVSEDDDVRLILEGVDISSPKGAAIWARSVDKLIITLAEGSANSLSDAAEYAYDDDNAPNAALYSSGHISINGAGSLTVTANYKHGVNAKDKLKICGGAINVTAVGDALHGKDGVAISAGALTLTAGDDGIQSDKEGDPEKGFVVIDGGSVTINAKGDGIVAYGVLQINAGELDIVTTGEAMVSQSASADEPSTAEKNADSNSAGQSDAAKTESDAASAEALQPDGLQLPQGDFAGQLPAAPQPEGAGQPPELPNGGEMPGRPDGFPQNGDMPDFPDNFPQNGATQGGFPAGSEIPQLPGGFAYPGGNPNQFSSPQGDAAQIPSGSQPAAGAQPGTADSADTEQSQSAADHARGSSEASDSTTRKHGGNDSNTNGFGGAGGSMNGKSAYGDAGNRSGDAGRKGGFGWNGGDFGGWGFDARGANTSESEVSSKGLKSDNAIYINSGTLVFDTADDAVHSNGDINITGGDFAITTGDDAFHAGATLEISGGVIDIKSSYEGLEGVDISISGGEISIIASDDGINAAGGADGSGMRGGWGDMFANGGQKLIISGGSVTVIADGDGIDSNGDIAISGGTVYVSGPTNSANSAVDYNGSLLQTGGTLVAAGAAGMAQNVSASSSQPGIMVYYTSAQPAGARITLTDESGAVLASYVPQKQYMCAVISTGELSIGKTYTLFSGGELSAAGELSGAEQLCEIEVTGAATTVSSDGTAYNGRSMGGRWH